MKMTCAFVVHLQTQITVITLGIFMSSCYLITDSIIGCYDDNLLLLLFLLLLLTTTTRLSSLLLVVVVVVVMMIKFSVLIVFTIIIVVFMSSYSGMIVTDVTFKCFVCLIMGGGYSPSWSNIHTLVKIKLG